MRLPLSHVAVQSPHSAHSPRTQNLSSQTRGQSAVSSDAPLLQFSPPSLASSATCRTRFLCPSHLSQALHALQGPHLHGTGSFFWHSCTPHTPTSLVGPSQGLPPLTLSIFMLLDRVCSP